jgi:hypothetical protein
MRRALVQSLILNSAELPTSLPSTSEQPPWSDVRRVYRRICLLRATGLSDEASALEQNEFAEVLAAARKAPKAAQEETRILAEEAERVASASLLADLLAPLLANKLQSAVIASAETAASVSTRKSDVVLASPPRRARVSSSDAPESATAGIPGIADMIDGMLSQEREYAPARRNT